MSLRRPDSAAVTWARAGDLRLTRLLDHSATWLRRVWHSFMLCLTWPGIGQGLSTWINLGDVLHLDSEWYGFVSFACHLQTWRLPNLWASSTK